MIALPPAAQRSGLVSLRAEVGAGRAERTMRRGRSRRERPLECAVVGRCAVVGQPSFETSRTAPLSALVAIAA